MNHFENSNIKIYPNPTTNELFIEGIETKTYIELFDISGKKLLEKYIGKNEFTINLLDLESGVY